MNPFASPFRPARDPFPTISRDLQFHILHHLPTPELWSVIASVCRHFRNLIHEPSVYGDHVTLSLIGSRVTGQDIIARLPPSGWHQLRVLDLSRCTLVTNFPILAILRLLPSLFHLSLAFTGITNKGFHDFSGCLSHLRSIDLSGLNITGTGGLSVLLAAEHTPNLTALSLASCARIDDEGVNVIAQLCNSRLRLLDLTQCLHISDAAFISLAEHCPNLLALNLADGVFETNVDEKQRSRRQWQDLLEDQVASFEESDAVTPFPNDDYDWSFIQRTASAWFLMPVVQEDVRASDRFLDTSVPMYSCGFSMPSPGAFTRGLPPVSVSVRQAKIQSSTLCTLFAKCCRLRFLSLAFWSQRLDAESLTAASRHLISLRALNIDWVSPVDFPALSAFVLMRAQPVSADPHAHVLGRGCLRVLSARLCSLPQTLRDRIHSTSATPRLALSLIEDPTDLEPPKPLASDDFEI
jgi:hypothetical protein